ncbi:hypothetical protein GCM10009626_43830 [Brachybacterium sacelli]
MRPPSPNNPDRSTELNEYPIAITIGTIIVPMKTTRNGANNTHGALLDLIAPPPHPNPYPA